MHSKPSSGERMTAAEAFAAVLYGAIAADGVVTHAEAIEVTHALSRTSMFRGLSEGQMRAALGRVRSIYKSRGPDGLLAAAAPSVPSDLRETAYAQCVDLVMADDRVEPEETAYLKKAQAALGVSDTVASRILEVVRILNKG